MGRFLISGGRPLEGRVKVSGSKNGALPVLFAALLAKDVCYIDNFPLIGDTKAALDILTYLGSEYTLNGDSLTLDTSGAGYRPVPGCLTSPLRASSYLIGSSLGAFGRGDVPACGGCSFASRPIDLHLRAAVAFGAYVEGEAIYGESLRPTDHTLPLPSVGATVNSLLIASSIHGRSRIRGAACEPHIDCLIRFLESMGAQIKRDGSTLTVLGGELHGGRVIIPGDMIEAGTYLCAGMLTGGEVTVSGFDPCELDSALGPLSLAGADISVYPDGAKARGLPTKPLPITASPYPGFPTDLQPIIAPVLASGAGGTIRDLIFKERFGYLSELSSFGVISAPLNDGVRILPSRLKPGRGRACDLRGGASLLLCALSTAGESEITDARTVLRGYSGLCEKLTSLGARIKIL